MVWQPKAKQQKKLLITKAEQKIQVSTGRKGLLLRNDSSTLCLVSTKTYHKKAGLQVFWGSPARLAAAAAAAAMIFVDDSFLLAGDTVALRLLVSPGRRAAGQSFCHAKQSKCPS